MQLVIQQMLKPLDMSDSQAVWINNNMTVNPCSYKYHSICMWYLLHGQKQFKQKGNDTVRYFVNKLTYLYRPNRCQYKANIFDGLLTSPFWGLSLIRLFDCGFVTFGSVYFNNNATRFDTTGSFLFINTATRQSSTSVSRNMEVTACRTTTAYSSSSACLHSSLACERLQTLFSNCWTRNSSNSGV